MKFYQTKKEVIKDLSNLLKSLESDEQGLFYVAFTACEEELVDYTKDVLDKAENYRKTFNTISRTLKFLREEG